MGRNDRTAAGGSERPASKRSHISLGIGLGPMAAPSAFLRAQQASVSSYRIKVMGTCGAAAAGITLACRAKLWHNFRVIVVTSLHGSAVASFSLLCREKMALLLLLQVPIPPSCYYVPTLPQTQNAIFFTQGRPRSHKTECASFLASDDDERTRHALFCYSWNF